MADNRTWLSAADLAAQFRDVCGDGSMEWVYTPMQTWLLLDAADMLEEFVDTPKCETCEAMLDCDECLRADASQKERKRLDYENARLRSCLSDADENARLIMGENAELRELVWDMWEGYNDPRCEECHLKDTPTCADCPICAREASVIDRMRELGVVE